MGQEVAAARLCRLRASRRRKRSIALTDAGRLVYRYADEIFAIGRDLQDALRDRPQGQPLRFAVGVADTLPKVLVHRLLAPASTLGEDVRITCIDGPPDRLLAELAIHEIDLVVSDFPAHPALGPKAFNHLLGECGVSFCATAALASRYRRGFPRSLDGAPFLLPYGNTALRRALEHWFDHHGIRPHVRGEFADSGLMKVFGASGDGIFAVPTVVEADVRRAYGVRAVGRERSVRERFYAISVDKRIKHPAVVAITNAARKTLFVG